MLPRPDRGRLGGVPIESTTIENEGWERIDDVSVPDEPSHGDHED